MTRTIIILMLFCSFFTVHSQRKDSLSYAEQLALLEAEMDSLSIFSLIDSLFELDVTPTSELNIRLGFTSSVTSSGRDYDIDQQGFSPGLAYYHKSGLYADLSGYWSSDISPKYNPTIFSLGYLGSWNKNMTYSLDYERWFFNARDTSLNPLTNSLGVSLSYDFKIGYLGIDYTHLFGDMTSHRIIGTLAGNIHLGKWWKFNSVSIYPSATILYGNGNVTVARPIARSLSEEVASVITNITTFENLTPRQKITALGIIRQAFANGLITESERNSLGAKVRSNEMLTEEDILAMDAIAEGEFFLSNYVDENKFGLLNYAFTLPIALSSNRLTILISYTYSIPISLPGEELLNIDPLGYFGVSVNYRMPFEK